MKKIMLLLLSGLMTASAVQATDTKSSTNPNYFWDESKVYTTPGGAEYTYKNMDHLAFNWQIYDLYLSALKLAMSNSTCEGKYKRNATAMIIKCLFTKTGSKTVSISERMLYQKNAGGKWTCIVYHITTPGIFANNLVAIETTLQTAFGWDEAKLINTSLEVKKAALLTELENLITTSNQQINEVVTTEKKRFEATNATKPTTAPAPTTSTTKPTVVSASANAAKPTAAPAPAVPAPKPTMSSTPAPAQAPKPTATKTTTSAPAAGAAVMAPLTDAQKLAALQKEVAQFETNLMGKKSRSNYCLRTIDIEDKTSTILVYHPILASNPQEVENAEQFLNRFEGYKRDLTKHGPAAAYFEKNATYRPGEDMGTMTALLNTEQYNDHIGLINEWKEASLKELDAFRNKLDQIQDQSLNTGKAIMLKKLNALSEAVVQKAFQNRQDFKRMCKLRVHVYRLIALQKEVLEKGGTVVCTRNEAGEIIKLERVAVKIESVPTVERKRDIAWRWAKQAGITTGATASLLIALSAKRV